MARATLLYILFLWTLIPGKLMAQKQELNEIDWSLAASMPPENNTSPQPGVAGAVCGIIGNKMIIAGGANFPGGLPWTGAVKTYHDAIYIFEQNRGALKAPRAAGTQKLPGNIAYCGAVSTPGGIIYVGGENEKGISDKVYRLQYDVAMGGITVRPLPSLPLPLTNPSAAWCDNKLFIAGGESKDGPSHAFFCLNLAAPAAQWQALPALPVAVTHAVLIAQAGGDHRGLYLIGGRCKNAGGISTIYAQTFCYDIKTNQWTPRHPLPYSLSAASGIAWGTHSIIMLGGDRGEVFSAVEILAVKINAAKNETERDSLIKQKNELLAAHPGFNKDILLYNTIADVWMNIGRFPYAPVATTTALNWNGDIIIPSGEIKAGVRTPHIIKGKIITTN